MFHINKILFYLFFIWTILALIKALLKPHMRLYYIVIEKISKVKFCIRHHVKCCILYIANKSNKLFPLWTHYVINQYDN